MKYLFHRFAERSCTREELLKLYEQVKESDNEKIYGLMDAHYENLEASANADQVDWEYMFNHIIKQKITTPVRMLIWRRWAVAASIILMLGVGSYFMFFNETRKQNDIVNTNDTVPTDVKAPETNRAMITLANGRKIYLDNAANGSLVMQTGVKVEKLTDGRIVYTGVSTEVVYNMVSNPRGSKVIDMTLADGSKVWLNAGSSVTFPVAFVGNERKVNITGEAYFEVTHDASKPFYVSKGDMSVQVLGTHFNVNAYDDEENIKVTLLEGSVKVNNTIIKPGQQAQFSRDIKVVSNVNLEVVMAWKNDRFFFNNTGLKEIMRLIGRWYDVEVVYEGNVNDRGFTGKISRAVNVSQVLAMLEYAGVQFRMEGKRIVVLK